MKQQYILGKYTHIVVREEDAIFGAGSNQFIINDKNFWENLVLIAAQWIKKKTVDEVYNSLSLIMLKENFDRAFDFLVSNHFLVKAETSDNILNNRYSRSHLHYQMLWYASNLCSAYSFAKKCRHFRGWWDW
ncbi:MULTISPECIES: hypothetical protein [unclassified Bartonella]|uniref:hypothetical protein n=1 Tax=unclassified Bartonella TaxID=2645622 RepID=UPI0035D02B18